MDDLHDIIGRKKGVYRKIQKGETHLTGYCHILKRQASQIRNQESKKELWDQGSIWIQK